MQLVAFLVFAFSLVGWSSAQQAPPAEGTTASPEKPRATVKPPKAVKTPEPDLKFNARAKRKVVFKVQVGTDGLVHDPVLVQSSGSEEADAAALKAILRWTFKPATRDGVPVPIFINIEIKPPPQ